MCDKLLVGLLKRSVERVDLVSLKNSMNNALLSEGSDALALACSDVPKA